MVRIDPDTHRELCRIREEMANAEMMGLIELSRDNRERVSLDQIIRRLIAMRDKHAERRQRSAANRKSKGKREEIKTEEVSEQNGIPVTESVLVSDLPLPEIPPSV
jgi:hypothetical protein